MMSYATLDHTLATIFLLYRLIERSIHVAGLTEGRVRLLERTVVCAALIRTLRGERELTRLLHKQGAAGCLTHGEQQSYSILVFSLFGC